MIDKVENTLQELLGLELSQTSRAANMECFKFGIKTNNKNQNIGEFGLHVQSHWRIITEEKILVGSSDLYEPTDSNHSDVDFDYEEGNLRDLKLNNLLNSSQLVVAEVNSDVYGGLNIQFSNSMLLQIVPTHSVDSEYNEFWRLIDNRNEESIHIVARVHGVENE